MDLPLVGGADLAQGRALRRSAEAAEHQEVPLVRLVAVEVGNGRAVGAAGEEHEGVVAVAADQRVRTDGDQRVGDTVAGAGQPGADQVQRLDIGRQGIADVIRTESKPPFAASTTTSAVLPR